MADSPSFTNLRARHAGFLRRLSAEPVTPERVKEAQQFVESLRVAGRTVDDEDDREYLRSLLTFWGNWLYNHTRTYPDTNLEPFIGEKRPPAPPVSSLAPTLVSGSAATAQKEKADGQAGGGRATTFTCLGLVGLSILMLVVIGLLTPLFGRAMVAAPTEDPGIEQTVEALNATLQAPTPSAGPSNTTAAPTRDPGNLLTPTPANGVGGGGFVESISLISAQIIEPPVGVTLERDSFLSIGVAYSNMQAGWEMFYAMLDYATGALVVLPGSQPIGFENLSGVWVLPVKALPPGSYEVSLYVSTTREAADLLIKYGRAGEPLPGDIQFLEGLIRLGPLTMFSVK